MPTKFETPKFANERAMTTADGLQDTNSSHSYSGPLCTASLSMALLDIPLVASPQRSWVPTAARAEAAPTVALNAAPPKKSFNSSTSTKNLGAAPNAGDGVLPTEQQSGAVVRNIEGSARSGESRVPAMGSPFPKFGWSRRQNSIKPPKQDIAGGRKVSIVWFRSDMRVHDNEVLTQAHAESSSVVPVYVFDPQEYGKTSSGFDKTGPYRAQFLIECVQDLRRQLHNIGSELVVRIGQPADVLARLVKDTGANTVYSHSEVTAEECQLEAKVKTSVKDNGAELKIFWGSTLYHIEDLPFTLDQMPTAYGTFREKIKDLKIRPALKAPAKLKGFPTGCAVDFGDVPTLKDLGLRNSAKSTENSVNLVGGETEALERLKAFAVQESTNATSKNAPKSAPVKGVTKAHPEPAGANFSCKISPWLAMGCLSPRRMFEDLRAQATGNSSNKQSTHGSNDVNWLVFELLWRDFFRFVTKKYNTAQTPAAAPALAFT